MCHMIRDSPAGTHIRDHFSGSDAVFAVVEDRSAGRLADSGTMSHMAPHRSDLVDYNS
ncbi:hypothetical protein Plhal304r1_c010g0039221 [Plasmopara halstedii]